MSTEPVDTFYGCTYPVSMNVTLSIEERVVAEARQVAARRGTTLNQLIRAYLVELTQPGDQEAVVAELEALWSTQEYRSTGPWTREELHERS